MLCVILDAKLKPLGSTWVLVQEVINFMAVRLGDWA